MQRLRPQHLLVSQEIVVGPQEVVLRPRLEALLVPDKQTVPSMSTMSTEIVEASHSGQHQVTPVPQVQPAPQRPPLLPHLRLKLGGAAFTIHTFTCFAMFRRSCTSGLPDGPPPTSKHLLLVGASGDYFDRCPTMLRQTSIARQFLQGGGLLLQALQEKSFCKVLFKPVNFLHNEQQS